MEAKMDLGFKGKVALVTGAGSQIGFGKAICLSLAKEGCDIIATDIDLEGAQKTAAEVEALGRKAMALKADVTSGDEVNDMVKTALGKFGRIDILVNNAGTASGSPFAEATEEHWHINVDINLKGMWHCTKAVLPQMLERKSGKIVNLSSGAARIGFPYAALYCAAKAGIMGLTRSLAAEVGPSGINVNGLAPGMGDTGFQIAIKSTPEDKKHFISTVPLGRLTTAQDIANAVVFLASDAASDITGQTINIDGGDNRI
jgi:3-oxoacyl-[acyl-carrier protein] reductase